MIAQLKGLLVQKNSDTVVIDTHGVGYEVTISKNTFQTLPEIGQEALLMIYTHVTEGSISLFGFSSLMEKGLFKKCISVSGIGPKMGIALLSGMSCENLMAALSNSDVDALTAVSGVGKKTAERLIIELKDKMAPLMEQGFIQKLLSPENNYSGTTYSEVLSALVNLGYNRPMAERALSKVVIKQESTLEDVLKRSLGILGNQAGL